MTDSVLDSTSVVRIMDSIVLAAGPEPPGGIRADEHCVQICAAAVVGAVLCRLKLLPAAYSANDIRIYRLQDSVWTVESTVVLDTQAGYVSVKTNNLSAVFMALLDTVAVTVTPKRMRRWFLSSRPVRYVYGERQFCERENGSSCARWAAARTARGA